VGVLTLDADSDGSSSEDSHNKLAITGARTLTSASVMTLDATSGGIVRSGSGTMTLLAAAGIVLKDDFTSAAANQALVINADTDDNGTGSVFTISAGKDLVTNNGVLTLTAATLNLAGAQLVSGTALTTILPSNSHTLGLGSGGGQFAITDAELAKMTTNGLSIGGAGLGSVTITAVGQASSNAISGTITINAALDDAAVTFATTASVFNALVAQADNGIIVQADVTTDVGVLTLDADSDGSSSDDTTTSLPLLEQSH